MANALRVGLEPYPGFKLQQLLKKSAYGEVWQATQAEEGRPPVALKFISTDSGLGSAREIKAISTISHLPHPNLVRIQRVWMMPGYLAVAMELAEGSLADLLAAYQSEDGAPIPAGVVCSYLTQAARGLDFLNATQHRVDGRLVGFQHGAVKGSNLLVFGDSIKLSDFELCSSSTVPVRFQQEANIVDYVAPEVFEGYLTNRSDQHGLAVTYCELRGGRLPFPPINAMRESWPRRRPAADLTMLSPAEQPIIGRALSRVPQDRFPSCGELMAALTKAVGQ